MNTAIRQPQPAIFVSHGSPMLGIEPGTTGAFFARLGAAIRERFGTPRAILAVSPHTATGQPVLLAAAQHDTVHDFGGFPDALYTLRYDAPGAPDVAAGVAALLNEGGIPVAVSDDGGLDHGIWVPLRYMFPEANVPVLPLALVPHMPPPMQLALGARLAPVLGDGVLVLGTGSLTHNLRWVFSSDGRNAVDAPERAECAAFRAWVAERAQRGTAQDWEELLDYRKLAPHATLMHPTDEHWLPFYVAAGAGGAGRPGASPRLFEAVTYGSLAMDAYAFGPQAAALQQALRAP